MNFTKSMKTEAWLLDEDVMLRGTVKRKWFRHIFVPDNKDCGFSYQYVARKDIGKILFYDDMHIVYSGYMKLEREFIRKEIIMNYRIMNKTEIKDYCFTNDHDLLDDAYIINCSDLYIKKLSDCSVTTVSVALESDKYIFVKMIK